MPLLRKGSLSGFRPPGRISSDATEGDGGISLRVSDRGSGPRPPLSVGTVPHFLPLRRSAIAVPVNGLAMSSSSAASLPVPREVIYPQCRGETSEAIVAARLAKRSGVNYHQPEPKPPTGTKRPRPVDDTEDHEIGSVKADHESDDENREEVAPLRGSLVVGSVSGTAPSTTATPLSGSEAVGDVDNKEETASTPIVSRYPVSPYGKIYFQVEGDGATRHESTGIVVIDAEELGVMMFDRVGRQHGNRPDPGYPIRLEEISAAKAGSTLKVGGKAVVLITALTEESFRSGAFFLRSEHDTRQKEDRAKAMVEAAAAAAKVAKVNMTFGHALLRASRSGSSASLLFAAPQLRRRPREGQTGFIVPLAGRPQVGKNGMPADLVPLHDPDRANAVTLFRADYKRDLHGRRQVSVVVDPILGDKLRPHQRVGVQFLFDCITGTRMSGYHGAILADEMGLGKTIQTVATIYTCLKQGRYGVPTARKCLVVTPSSLVRNWCNEFDKWLGPGVVKYFAISESTPKGDRIISRFDGEGDVLVISYDQLRKYIARLTTLRAVELVVCDEGHRLKNAEVKTTKAVDMLPTRNRIILSGTPIQNDLSEFHAMVNFVNPGILGNRDLFARVFEEPVSLGRDPESAEHLKSLGRDRAHYLSVLTQRFILRRTQSINESYLPPKVDITVFVRLGKVQEYAYQRLADLVETAACTPLVLISAMRKLCNHMDLFHEAVQLSQKVTPNEGPGSGGRGRPRGGEGGGLPTEVIPNNFRRGNLSQEYGSKLHFLSLLLDELRTNGDHDKLVVVSNFTQTLDVIAELCRLKKIAFFQLDGSTPIKRRQELVDYFNIPNAPELVFLLSSKAGGVGLNLIGANRLILFDPDWNPANDAQAMGRVWRDGQKKRVFIYRLLSTGTIEEKIYQRQVSKQGLSANVVDMQEDSKQHFTLEELKALFRYKADTLCDTHDLLGCSNCEAAATLGRRAKAREKAAAANGVASTSFKRVGGGRPSGPRMDELKAWQHVVDIGHFHLDKVIRAVATRAPALVSLLFADERDNTKRQAEATLRVEKPFAEDEDKIICASQAAIEASESQLDIEVYSDGDDESHTPPSASEEDSN